MSKPKQKVEWRSRVVGFTEKPANQFTANALNFRRHPNAQRDAFRGVLSEIGFAGAVLENVRTGNLIDGHLRIEEALSVDELTPIPCVQVDLSESEERLLLATYDPISAMAVADKETLDLLLRDVSTGDAAVSEMLASLAEDNGLYFGEEKKAEDEEVADELISRAAELQEKWGVRRGDLFHIGRHRLMCGDSVNEGMVKRLLAETPHAVITDPPYCSGGFQESGRSKGSKGTDVEYKLIANDTLSTRGYISLIKSVLSLADAPIAYLFTDWRMWVNLFDVVESLGYGVRNMIVWDKGSPGMGVGWRTQHELVMFGTKSAGKFDNHKAQGNVIQCARTGNKLHATEKPVELIAKILAVTDFVKRVYEPFNGSGTTMVACEQERRDCYSMEMDEEYCAVTLERMSLLGLTPELIDG